MSDSRSSSMQPLQRLVVVGRNSVLWSRIADRVLQRQPDTLAVGHRDLDGLHLKQTDCVWIFSYGPDIDANCKLFEQIATSGAGRFVYLSSATANIADRIRCYRYPAVKRAGERDAARILQATPIRIGLIHDDPAELPGGWNAATQLDDLVSAMSESLKRDYATDECVHLYKMIERPFSGAAEQMAYRGYGRLLGLFGRLPCLLRPLDVLLRIIGWRCYGYLRLSNEQCRTTT